MSIETMQTANTEQPNSLAKKWGMVYNNLYQVLLPYNFRRGRGTK